METIKLRVTENQIEVFKRPSVITAGTVGLEAEFNFDSQWDILSKTLVFKAGEKVVTKALTGDSCIVPWEVLEQPKQWLRVGVYGANGEGTVVIPTLWAEVAVIHTGADPTGDPATDPTAPIWQEALHLAEQGAAAEQELRAGVDSLAQDLNLAHESPNLGDVFMELLAYDRYNEYALYDHTDNRGNPHDVTCEKIGAATVEDILEVNEKTQNLDEEIANTSVCVNIHIQDEGNPHNVTYEQVGAAPSGYGCGEASPKAQNWNSQFRSGFYRESANSPDGSLWYGITCVDNANYQTQIAFKRTDDLLEARRYKYAGTWSAWEYVNPPFAEGVEYRTTERRNGKAVYKKLENDIIYWRIDGSNEWKQ